MKKLKEIIAALTPKQKRWIALGFGFGLAEATVHSVILGWITPDQAKSVVNFVLITIKASL